MASLINCQPVAAYTAEEFAGDTPLGAAALELQTPPTVSTTAPWSLTASAYFYYLVIKSNSGFNIKAQDINISGASGEFDTLDTSTTNEYQWLTGSTQGDVLPNNVWNIRVINSLLDSSDCSNEVVAEIMLNPSFVMPANDVTINIDFGGTAIECEPQGEDTVIVNTSISSRYSVVPMLTSSTDYDLYIAKYYFNLAPDGSLFSSSYFSTVNSIYNNYGYGASGGGALQALSFIDVAAQAGNMLDPAFLALQPCLGQSQPSCYSGWITGDPQMFETSGSSYTATNNIGNTQGRLLALPALYANQPWGGAVNLNDALGPDSFNGEVDPTAGLTAVSSQKTLYTLTSNPNDSNYLSFEDNPTITPNNQGPVLPTYEEWYISIASQTSCGIGCNVELVADASCIDIWAAITTVFNESGTEFNTPPYGPFSASVSINLNNYNYIEYTPSDNQCHFDLSEVELFQVNTKTVKVRVPYRTDLVINRTNNPEAIEGNYDFHYDNKIFINVYPIET